VVAVVAGASPADFATLADANNLKPSLKYFRSIGIIRDENFPPRPESWLESFQQVNPSKDIASCTHAAIAGAWHQGRRGEPR